MDERRQIAIIGLGLIGGSLSLALKESYRIIGCDSDPEVCRYALAHGFADEIREVKDLRGVACAVICTPPETVADMAAHIYEAVGESALITDVCGVKSLLALAKGRVVGGHPMAGSERGGIYAAKAHLFENATYCVVPYEHSRAQDICFVEELARAVKAHPVRMTASAHDEATALFSHMPHLVAYALAACGGEGDTAAAGSGYMDTTRIAASDPALWVQLLRRNKANTVAALKAFSARLSEMSDALAAEDYERLYAALSEGQAARLRLQASRSAQEFTLRADVRDEVGSIERVTELLRRAGANLANLQILSSRDGIGGALELRFATARDAAAARKALCEHGYTIE